jgi:polar amino acid transport system substrate-binding protein
VVERPPWVTDSAGQVRGLEGALVAELARELGATPEWVRGPESPLLEALHRRELDLVIGGFTDDTPWRDRVALTASYYTDTIVVGVLPGSPPLGNLEGEQVAVERGDPAAAHVREQGATRVTVDDLARATGPVAAPVWRLSALGRVSSGIVLYEAKHVVAAAPGENAWLVHLERFLRARRAGVPAALRAAAP